MKEDGGAAFPASASDVKNVFGDQNGNEYYPGMSLRDWYAGKALQGLLGQHRPGIEYKPNLSTVAWELADAMLEGRGVDLTEYMKGETERVLGERDDVQTDGLDGPSRSGGSRRGS